jgi:GTPase SAR1 family protein
MSSFKTFFGNVGGVNTNNTNKAQDYWDVVLFNGTYDPITRDEHEKVKKFIKEIVNSDKHKNKFSPTVEFGLMCNDDTSSNSAILDKFKYNLTHDEKEFISAKLFGLRMFPINFTELSMLAASVDKSNDTSENLENSIKDLKKSFQKANILIVLNKSDELENGNGLEEITKKFESEDLNIGFITWDPSDAEPIEFLGNTKMSGQIIKAICLMDFERPNPDELKSFCYKYKLANILDLVRTIHFKVMGEKYLLAFRSLFPDLTIFGDEEEDEKDINYIFIMELLKKMYLRELYQNRVTDRQQEAQKEVSEDIGLKPIISSSTNGGGAGGASASSGGSSSSTSTPEETPDESGGDSTSSESTSNDEAAKEEPSTDEGF